MMSREKWEDSSVSATVIKGVGKDSPMMVYVVCKIQMQQCWSKQRMKGLWITDLKIVPFRRSRTEVE